MVKNPSPLQGFEIQIQVQNMSDFWIFFKSENPIHPTRFGPNRVAADMEGNEEFDLKVIFDDFWRN